MLVDRASVVIDTASVVIDYTSVVVDCKSVVVDCTSVVVDCTSVVVDCTSVVVNKEPVLVGPLQQTAAGEAPSSVIDHLISFTFLRPRKEAHVLAFNSTNQATLDSMVAQAVQVVQANHNLYAGYYSYCQYI